MDTPKMNILHFQGHKHTPNKHNNTKQRLTQEQVSLLESSFNSFKKLEPERKLRLARQLGLPPRRIAIWYQNKRARWKAQSLEFDYNGLQQSLDVALAEKWRLEKDVEMLKEELEKAQEMLIALNQTVPPSTSYMSTTPSFDEGMSFGMHEEVVCGLENDHNEVWQLEELYDSFMGADGSKWN